MTTPTHAQSTAEVYLQTWNARGADRARLLADHWTADAVYVDPLGAATGHDGLADLIGGVQQQFPDFVFQPVGEVDAHHRQMRFQWGLGPAGAPPLIVGFDVIVLADDGRIADVRGFLDQVPS
ncbi:nuclear transport factor 2 family protein [Gordonia neofelifaecis]|uniref:Isomerase n=1 Tax=Gordonia neofelifaecis NRRL B-59395 TaxID=644548 RepID=F1YP65_9ACTN|nr:nuclear transport factor 2 family protein [Gordonia neofelifaecis]EGD53514.1 isomerase [Gordonia neofelifaecis NRRL B-59395]